MHRVGRVYRCTFGWTDLSAKTKCDYTTSTRVRLSRVEAWTDDGDSDSRSESFGLDRESL